MNIKLIPLLFLFPIGLKGQTQINIHVPNNHLNYNTIEMSLKDTFNVLEFDRLVEGVVLILDDDNNLLLRYSFDSPSQQINLKVRHKIKIIYCINEDLNLSIWKND